MIDNAVHPANVQDVEAMMRAELARSDVLADNVQPVLRHLLRAQDGALFSDEILARARGMITDLARNLLQAQIGAGDSGLPRPVNDTEIDGLVRALMDSSELLGHIHALAVEWSVAERLQARLALDPVVSPLLQSLVSSEDEATQALAMTWLAAQARWCQAQRRMSLPFGELSGELLHAALRALRVVLSGDPDGPTRVATMEAAIRARYDEGASRLGLATRLVLGLGENVRTALMLEHGGLALFLTALAMRSGQARDVLVLSTHDAHAARLALAMRAAGLETDDVARQMLTFHPAGSLSFAIEHIETDLAGAILATGRHGG